MTGVATAGPAPPGRRNPTEATSARGLLFTILGELVLPDSGALWTSAAIDALDRLGVEEKATRQALTRMAAGGWLVSERHGRRTRWTLTERCRRLLTEGTERIYGFAGLAEGWDGRWLLVLAGTADGDRATRHLVRSRLAWAGLGTPRPGLWISTHADRLDEVREVLRQAGVLDDSQVFVATHAGGGDLQNMVRLAWDLDEVARAYGGFLEAFPLSAGAPHRAVAAAGRSTDDALARLTELVHAWRAFPRIDPALPRELLPDGWIGERAARAFAACHDAWAGAAGDEWQRINGEDP